MYRVHTVTSTSTLAEVSKLYGVTALELAEVNRIKVTQVLNAGTELLVITPDNSDDLPIVNELEFMPMYTKTKEVTVGVDQSVYDLAIQHCGDVHYAPVIGRLNFLSWTYPLPPGITLKVPVVTQRTSGRIANYFTEGNYKPSSGEFILPEGIDFWGIEIDFIVGGIIPGNNFTTDIFYGDPFNPGD
jgi:LysM repeat protein